MKLRPSFPEIPADNPFANCKLEREPFAKILTSVIDCAEGGFTMALNGSWAQERAKEHSRTSLKLLLHKPDQPLDFVD